MQTVVFEGVASVGDATIEGDHASLDVKLRVKPEVEDVPGAIVKLVRISDTWYVQSIDDMPGPDAWVGGATITAGDRSLELVHEPNLEPGARKPTWALAATPDRPNVALDNIMSVLEHAEPGPTPVVRVEYRYGNGEPLRSVELGGPRTQQVVEELFSLY